MKTRWLLAFGLVVFSFISSPVSAGDASERKVDVSNQSVFPLRWQQNLVREGTHRTLNFTMGRPVVSNRHKLVVVGTGEGQLLGLSSHSGRQVWSRTFPSEIESFGGVGDLDSGQEVVLFSSRDGKYHCVETDTGKVVWSIDLGTESRAEPNILTSGVLVTTAQSELVLLNIETGERIWSKRRTPPTGMTVLGHSRPLIVGDKVYLGFADGYVAAYDLKTGKELWAVPAALNQGQFLDVDTDPVIVNGLLVVASYASGLAAFDPETGKPVWQQKARGINRLASDGKRLFAASGDGIVWRLDPRNGSVVYRVRMEDGPISRMTLKGNLLTFSGGPNGLVVLDVVKGTPLQATALRGGANSAPNWSDLGIFVLSNRGDLYAFDIR